MQDKKHMQIRKKEHISGESQSRIAEKPEPESELLEN